MCPPARAACPGGCSGPAFFKVLGDALCGYPLSVIAMRARRFGRLPARYGLPGGVSAR